MNAIIQIHGREAIPVRALPWLTAWEFSAQAVAEALAHDEGYESFDGMEAYCLDDGAIQPVRVGEWLNSVTISIEEIAERELPRTEWQKLSLAALPAGVFVWRDEWEPAYNRSPDGPDSLAALGDAADDEDVAKRTLHFAPRVPPELVNLVMQGFTQLGVPESEQTAAMPASAWGNTRYSRSSAGHAGSASNAPAIDPPPVATSRIAVAFAHLRGWDEKKWKDNLGSPPKWLEACIALRGQRGIREHHWNPVLIGAALLRDGHAKQNNIRARFQTKHQLEDWEEAWKTYEADNFDTQ